MASARSPPQSFRGATFAWNCATPAEVDVIFAKAIEAGAGLLRKPEKTDYGGYRGYFSDPDGHAWEVVRAPGFAFTGDGRLILPEKGSGLVLSPLFTDRGHCQLT